MSGSDLDLLFVYGSLLSGAGHEMGARLAAEAALLGAARLQGRLYRVSRYPGAVESAEPADAVHGEVWRLADPVAALSWLDAYEDVDPGTGLGEEYARVARPVRLAPGGSVRAWVYLYRRPVTGLEPCPSGRWLECR